MRHIFDAKVPMRDGVRLSADVYLPGEEGAYPAILVGTPYDNTMKSHVDMASFFTRHGYAFMVYDVRGRYDSEGEFYPFFNEGPDGFDAVEWAASQPWCNGRIGMMGGSYRGWIQWATARERPPHLETIVPTATGGNWLQEFPFLNGVPCLWMLQWLNFVGGRTNQNVAGTTVDWGRVLRHRPLRDMPRVLGREMPVWVDFMDHPDMGEFWEKVVFKESDFQAIDLPVLHITGYYDGDQPGALHYYWGAVEHGPRPGDQYLLIGPWDHAGTRVPRRLLGGVDFTNEALVEMREVHLAWFDHWLKDVDNEVSKWPRTRFFVMGENKWGEMEAPWPKSPAYTPLYLHSGGAANTHMGDGELLEDAGEDGYDEYQFNPLEPATTVQGFDAYGDAQEAPLDRRYLLRRDDYLGYTGPELGEPLEILGPPRAELWVSSDCPDTDFFAYLFDVHPDGRSILVSRGLMRARYRHGLKEQRLLEPGKVERLSVPMDSTCVKFLEGHRVRLAVTSSEFPRYAPNTNTGNPVATDTQIKVASNRVHHGKAHPSRLLLPRT